MLLPLTSDIRRPAPALLKAVVLKRRPTEDPAVIDPLAVIWDEVVHRVLVETLALDADEGQLHLNVKAEITEEIARLTLWIGDRVLDRRLGDRPLSTIDPEIEREACLGDLGRESITKTAVMTHEHIWGRLMKERWLPKSAKAIERDANPRRTKLVVKPVDKNHFIPKSFIRDHWTTEGRIQRWRRADQGWTCKTVGFGEWGYRRNLYSHEAEAYFGLVEGDAKEPIRRLLRTSPLNDPQRLAFVGFLIIQMLRSPFLVDAIGREAKRVADEIGHRDPNVELAAYDSLYRNNALYNQLAYPVMWSRWAIVRSDTPAFVLPDTFLVRDNLGDGLRVIVPLTPHACFVTLPDRESEKRVVPFYIKANAELAAMIGDLLCRSAVSEFLSGRGFGPRGDVKASMADVLGRLADLVGDDG